MKIFKCCMALAVFFMAMASSFAQDRLNPKVGDTIVLKSYCKVQNTGSFLNNGTKTLANQNTFLQYLEPNVKYMINSINDQTVDLVALDYQPLSAKKLQEKQKTKPEAFDKSLYYNGKIYTVLHSEFNDSAVRKPKEDTILSIGLLTLPFKARPQNDFSFDTEFNINTTLNVRIYEFKKIKTSLNWQFGTGIGTVSLNSSNAKGITAENSQDVALLSLSSGLMLQYRKIQTGIYLGVDHINNQQHYQWQSNGKIWFGFGIGFNVFKISLGEDNKNSN
jgi:hypothetical protein